MRGYGSVRVARWVQAEGRGGEGRVTAANNTAREHPPTLRRLPRPAGAGERGSAAPLRDGPERRWDGRAFCSARVVPYTEP
jgi:hypothetical protein